MVPNTQPKPDLAGSLTDCWKTVSQVSIQLIKKIDPDAWNEKIPGYPRKTIGMLAAHLHNVRCMWIHDINGKRSVKRLERLDPRRSTKKETMRAMTQSSEAMSILLERCLENGGRLPARPAWLNFPDNVIHLLAYFIAHEAHHRGQILMALRLLGQPLKRNESGELWQWNRRRKNPKD